ncbi:hypothetical protein ACFFSY_11595 [Paenibacillus aurantiacus]|uniref:Uncharacterized protein n=1 Tax=Paenibacillus aurantiacus TaxID=1936118 RepID=A0ABV5KMX4_9BACL
MKKAAKKSMLVSILAAVALTAAIPVSAAEVADPSAEVVAFIGTSQQSSSYIVGKAYALSNNSNFKSINVSGVFSVAGVQKESGTATSTTKGAEAAWYTKDSTYSSKVTAKLTSASRTYYKDGTQSAQSYATPATW